jgi:penicillin-binding protein 2
VNLGWRLTAVGAFLVALFAMLVLRLWFLQVSSIEDSLEVAQSQQLRTVTIEAPRGDIFDRNGESMAGTVAALRLVVDRALLPAEREEDLISNLAALFDVPASEIREEFDSHGPGTRFPFGGEVSEATALFTLEHSEDFPGVVVEPQPVRIYPLGETAAHVIGYIGAPGESDLERPGITPNDRVGRFGIERFYDRLLRGTPGRTTFRVNASGDILGIVEEVPPVPGGSVVSTLDLDIQRRLEGALVDGIRLAQENEEPVIRAAGVVMDPRDGSVLAMASVPSFDPSLFADGRITDAEWQSISEKAALNNFVIQGLYPPASAFKVVAFTLALERGIYPTIEQEEHVDHLDPNDPSSFFCDGELQFPNTPLLEDWREHGLVNIHSALWVSCDNYFWGIALEIWLSRGEDYQEDLLQQWARILGFGSPTNVDLPFEQLGLVPDREWFQYHQVNQTGLVRPEGGWSGGDVMNIAIGQGALTVTPLQLANAYAALVNGGTLWAPRTVDTIRDGTNEIIFRNQPSVLRTVEIAPTTVIHLKNDLNGVVINGTARTTFENFCGPGVPRAECEPLLQLGGKTGTAEIVRALSEDEDDIDTAWFVGVAPLDDPEYVVAVVIDQGGSGGRIAAPVARAVLQYLMGVDVQPIRSGGLVGEDTE